jgi:hypothetical protein
MPNFQIAIEKPEEIIPRLGKPELHWKKGRSAYELATAWMEAGGIASLFGFACLIPAPLNAQQSLLGKSCLGTFDTRKSTDSEYDLGAVRINFGSTMPLKATTEVAPGKAAFSRPDTVTKYDSASQATDISYANKKLAFTTTSGSKWKFTGDGISFTGQVDPRPRLPNIAFVKLNCK